MLLAGSGPAKKPWLRAVWGKQDLNVLRTYLYNVRIIPIHIYIYIYVFTYIYIYMYICIYIYMCVVEDLGFRA